METTVCPITGTTDFEPLFVLPDRFDPSSSWRLVRSRQSGLLMLNPRPAAGEMPRHYPAGSYDPHLHEDRAASLQDRVYLMARKLLQRKKASLVLQGECRPAGACSILEIGCSTGDLLRCLHRNKGIPPEHLAGIESDAGSATVAERVTGVRIYRTGPGELGKEACFDRIVFWHVFEHLHDLHGTLEESSARLRQNGVMVMALPNPESLDARHYREHWIAWDAPRHLWHFTPATLSALLEQHGLEIFSTIPYLPDTLYACWHSERLSASARKRRFGFAAITRVLLQTARCMAADLIRPGKASGVIYYIRKTS